MMPTPATFTQQSFESPRHSNQKSKRNKMNPNWNGRIKKVTICSWHDTIHRISKRCQQNLLELINEFGNVAGYKININKSVAILYTSNELSEREIKETILFTITSKTIKHLRINLTK